ncbi:lysylphosphatidylglycerol synthase domain-containing protein [Tropicibacter naphthalenivorans]|uniref:Flippase-like domain-containing protein n=1 Tax=Tropicibacter naphthalenivorans TaxID=441103 RepID=A0A0P1GDR3_9RHOB|nr:lysylphosphatidylglycerol synthase domain-containing protein [Tropicibacter naphthalenivorans]CUH79474.1 hypothetical protein TRN7648_02491 [Tropicibacter naphthalenivorans]SMC72848.1 Lysylphosphatidylglycerol synthase TM region [Tropicibacter naphthalenivorans]
MSTRTGIRRAAHIAVLALSLGAAVLWVLPLVPDVFAGWPLGALLGAAALYLLAHGVRAVRLAVLASRLLAISGRSSALLHFITSPAALVIPFKLGEALRLHQLWYLGQSLSGAVLVILLERLFDGAMLLLLLAIAYLTYGTLGTAAIALAAITSLAVITAVVVFVLGPSIFASLQRYMVVHHRDPRVLRVLPHIDMMRWLTRDGAGMLRDQGGVLLVLSLLIWLLEVGAATALLSGAPGLRLIVEGIFSAGGAGPTTVWMALGVLALVAVWPLALWRYQPRIPAEPLRFRRAEKGRFTHVD